MEISQLTGSVGSDIHLRFGRLGYIDLQDLM